MLTATQGLCREPRSADTQETEVPVQQVKEHGTDGDTAYRRSVTQMPDDGGVHNTYQRYRYIRQDTWQRQT